MLSKKMYAVLSCFPQSLGKGIRYEKLIEECILSKEEIDECLNETLFSNSRYVRSSEGWRLESTLYITESGLAEVEKYEDKRDNNQTIKRSVCISIVAMIAALASVVVAVISFFYP